MDNQLAFQDNRYERVADSTRRWLLPYFNILARPLDTFISNSSNYVDLYCPQQAALQEQMKDGQDIARTHDKCIRDINRQAFQPPSPQKDTLISLTLAQQFSFNAFITSEHASR